MTTLGDAIKEFIYGPDPNAPPPPPPVFPGKKTVANNCIITLYVVLF